MNILCIGELLCDVVMKPIRPEDFEGGRAVLQDFAMHGGGDGNNATIDLKKLGENVRQFALVGDDFLADRIISLQEAEGIDTRYVKRVSDLGTTVSVLMLGTDGDVTLGALKVGASRSCTASDIPDEAYQWAEHVHLVSTMSYPKMDGEGTGEIMRKAHENGCTTSMDTNLTRGTAVSFSMVEEALKNCDVFLPSHYEIEALTGMTDPRAIADRLKGFGLKVFGIKLGEKGVYLTDYNEEFIQPSLYEGVPVDVIGAGDAFSSTFVSAWKRGYSLRDAGAIASAASANIIASVGATAGMKSFDELLEFANARGALGQSIGGKA